MSNCYPLLDIPESEESIRARVRQSFTSLPTVDGDLYKTIQAGEGGGHVGTAYKRRFRGQNWFFIRSTGLEADGKIWAHLSVSRPDRCPTHEEMIEIKRDFLGDLPAVSVWVPTRDHVNVHPNCLHLWACLEGNPLPDFRKFGQI